MAKRRKFTPKFKAEVVLEALRGETSQAELCRRHNLSENQVSTWKRQLLKNADEKYCALYCNSYGLVVEKDTLSILLVDKKIRLIFY